jgi:hypothetical protein
MAKKKSDLEKFGDIAEKFGNLIETTAQLAQVNLRMALSEAAKDVPAQVLVCNHLTFERLAGAQTLGQILRENSAQIAVLVKESANNETFIAAAAGIMQAVQASATPAPAPRQSIYPDSRLDIPDEPPSFLSQASTAIEAFLLFGGDRAALDAMLDKFKKVEQ